MYNSTYYSTVIYHINFFVLFYCFSRLMALKRMGIVENYEVRVG